METTLTDEVMREMGYTLRIHNIAPGKCALVDGITVRRNTNKLTWDVWTPQAEVGKPSLVKHINVGVKCAVQLIMEHVV